MGGARGLVLAFEPNPFAARLLTENVRLNGLHDRIEILRLAIGESRARRISTRVQRTQ